MSRPIEDFAWLIQPEPWMDESSCKGLDPAMFHMEQGQSATKAKEICNSCLVSSECLDYGRRTGSIGVWGGQVLTLAKRGARSRPIEITPVVLITRDSKPVAVSPGVKRRRQGPQPPTGQIAASKSQ